MVVEEFLDAICQVSVFREVLAADVSRGNDSIAGQLPNVQLVDLENSFNLEMGGARWG